MKTLIKKPTYLLIVITSLFLAANLWAAGTNSADFLNIAVGARPAGMGEAFVAVADETSGMFYNPAGLGYSISPEVQAMYSMWIGDLKYNYLGYSHPTTAGTFGLGIQYLTSPAIDGYFDGASLGSISYTDAAYNILYANKVSQGAAFGCVLKSVSNTIGSDQVSALSGDFGLLFRTPEEGFSFGVSAQNLTGAFGQDALPQTVRGGLALKASLPQHYSDIMFTLEAGRIGTNPLYYAAGVEHWGANTLGLRIGYKYSTDDLHRASLDALAPWRAGISVRIDAFSLDYAYQPFAALSTAHRISLSWRTFGWQKRWKIVPAQLKADPNLFSPNNDGGKDSVFFISTVTEIKEIKRWKLQITDTTKNVVKEFVGEDVLPKILTWEGQTSENEIVSEGKYLCIFIAEGDGRKRAKSEYGEIIADLTPPAAIVEISTKTISPNNDGLADKTTFYVSVTDVYGIDQWSVKILNEHNKVVKKFKSASKEPVEFVWDGKDDYYKATVPNGTYTLKLTVWDKAGNKTVKKSKIKVYIPPIVKEVVKEIVKEVKVKEEKRGLVVNLSSNIMFKIGKSKLRPIAYKTLDEVVKLLNTYPDNDVMIEGHTDSTGSRKRNFELSSARAWATYSYLVKHGVAPSRLKVKGYGPDKPVASNRNRRGRSRNRRVEIIILKDKK